MRVSALIAAAWTMTLAFVPARSHAAISASANYQAGDVTVQAGVNILTHGPVHEAFAEVVQYEPQPGIIVRREPPPLIEEVPPDVRPAGDNVVWISGYWGWDDSVQDFVWVTGIWRAIPQGCEWVPGYWQELDDGSFQWVSGFWRMAGTEEVTYLPTPPETVETQPVGEAPAANYVWVPGHWVWTGVSFEWSPGYWTEEREGYVWVPAHYVWTPVGCVFVDGYWDYDLSTRGVLFAPVYYESAVYRTAGYSYTPSVVVNATLLVDCLFVRPRYGHYYFGDYFDPHYASLHIYPWYYGSDYQYGYYDPLLNYYQATHGGPQGVAQLATRYQQLRDTPKLRPARLFTESRRADFPLARTLADVRRAGGPGLLRDLRPIDAARRQQFAQQAHQLQDFRDSRSKLETSRAGGALTRPRALDLPRSPVMSRGTARIAPPEPLAVGGARRIGGEARSGVGPGAPPAISGGPGVGPGRATTGPGRVTSPGRDAGVSGRTLPGTGAGTGPRVRGGEGPQLPGGVPGVRGGNRPQLPGAGPGTPGGTLPGVKRGQRDRGETITPGATPGSTATPGAPAGTPRGRGRGRD